MSTALTTLTGKLAARLGIEGNTELENILKVTAFKQRDGSPPSDAQMTALMIVANHIEISASGCWNWTGATSRGYGKLTSKGKHQTAHRFAFENLVEPIKTGLWVLHRCDNKVCVNPNHLYQGTPINNRADMLERKRWSHPWGRRTHCAKGHDYETGGFYVSKTDGSRVCRTCQRDSKRAQRAAQKEAA